MCSPGGTDQVFVQAIVTYGAIQVRKPGVDIQEMGPWVASQCYPDQPIHPSVFLLKWVRVLASGSSPDTIGSPAGRWSRCHQSLALLCACGGWYSLQTTTVLGQICSSSPILQLPKHLLCVTTNTEVKNVQRIKELPPDLALVH